MSTSGGTFERRHSVLSTRRHWSDAEKRAIVAETRLPGANVSAISRRHGAAQSLIYQWRKLFAATEVLRLRDNVAGVLRRGERWIDNEYSNGRRQD